MKERVEKCWYVRAAKMMACNDVLRLHKRSPNEHHLSNKIIVRRFELSYFSSKKRVQTIDKCLIVKQRNIMEKLTPLLLGFFSFLTFTLVKCRNVGRPCNDVCSGERARDMRERF